MTDLEHVLDLLPNYAFTLLMCHPRTFTVVSTMTVKPYTSMKMTTIMYSS